MILLNYLQLVRIPIAFLTILIFRPASYGQIPEKIFYDTLTSTGNHGRVMKGLGDGRFMYLSGSSYGASSSGGTDNKYLATVSKLDTSGRVLWTAHPSKQYPEFFTFPVLAGFYNSWSSELIKSGNAIYATAEFYHYSYPDAFAELWSINDSTGTVSWTKRFPGFIKKIADFNSDELLLLTGYRKPNGGTDFTYRVVNKASGQQVYSNMIFPDVTDHLAGFNDLFVDNNKNVLIAYGDTVWKYRDSHLSQLAWRATELNPASPRLNILIGQSGSNYLFMGRNFVKAADTATGDTRWLTPVRVYLADGPNFQGEDFGYAEDFVTRDSSLYVTWRQRTVGGTVRRGFALSRLNILNGSIGFNVAYDFEGVPVDAWPYSNDIQDWPMKMSMDSSYNIYLTGSYDRAVGPDNPGNWGIMKIDGKTGDKIYEATITEDITSRMNRSQGRFMHYFNGRMYAAGNLELKLSRDTSKTCLVSFDTLPVYNERYRKFIESSYRYPSSLVAVSAFSANKMVLLKQVGRSLVLEMRSSNDDAIWSKTFAKASKFIEPQTLVITKDNKIAFSAISYLQHSGQPLYRDIIDSLLFFKLDSAGNTQFSHRIKVQSFDSVRTLQVYNDKNNVTNFFYLRKCASCPNDRYRYAGYTLDSIRSSLAEIGFAPYAAPYFPKASVNPVQHIRADTMGIFVASPGPTPAYLGMASSRQNASGFDGMNSKWLPKLAIITSAIKVDSLSFVVMGTDSSSNAMALYYRYLNNDPLQWAANMGPGIVYNADTSASAVYTLSQRINLDMFITRLDKNTGAVQWQRAFTAAPGSVYFPVSLVYNSQKSRVTVVGYITDTTRGTPDSRYFYLSFDPNGNLIKEQQKPGDLFGDSRIRDVAVLQNGLTLIGGSVMTKQFGQAGFYNGVDTATSIVTGITPVVPDDFSLVIYPNPANDMITVQFTPSTFNKTLSFSFIDVNGQLMKTEILRNVTTGLQTKTFHLNMRSGLYFLRINGVNKTASVKPILIIR